jgi:hypothetical protein
MKNKNVRIPLLLLALIFSSVNVDARSKAAVSIEENIEMTEQNADEKVKLENPSDAPLVFTEVVLKPHRREGEPGDKAAMSFNLTVKNQTNRRITRFSFTQKPKSGVELHAEKNIAVEPNSTQTFLVQIVPKEPTNLTVTMTGVQFEDGTQWGSLQGLPGGQDGLLGKPQSSMLGSSSQTILMGKVQQGTVLQGPQPNSLFDTNSQQNKLFGKTGGQSLLKTTQPSMLKARQ